MKKLFALMLALCLMLGCTAVAENAVSWEDVAPQLEAAGVTGEFVTFEQISIALFIPTGASAAELPDDSYIGYFTSDDGSADTIAVMYVDVNGMTLEEYYAYLQSADGVTGLEAGTVNSLPCLSYEYNGCLICSFTTQMGYILEVIVGPVSTDEEKTAASFILASIQAVE